MLGEGGEPKLPHASPNFWQERAGILALADAINRLGLIWRETPMGDVGIDGQIEFVNSAGQATGQLVAVQVKSGTSYLRDGGAYWIFYPEAKHRLYWERFPLPVLLVLHSPDDGALYWTDARQNLRIPERSSQNFISVPKSSRLSDATAEELFSTAGASSKPFLSVEQVLGTLIGTISNSPTFPISHFDLFANGLTNIGRSIYYGMDLAVEIADANLNQPYFGFGSREHDFLFNFVEFLVEQHLADINIADCLIDWMESLVQPAFIAPLTSRGRELVRFTWELQNRYAAEGRLDIAPNLGVAQEGFVRMELTASHRERLPLIAAFQEQYRRGHPR